MPSDAKAPSASVEISASVHSVEELGSLPPQIQQEVVSLIERVTKDPYDPEIVSNVTSLSEDNRYFVWTLQNGDTMFWRVDVPVNRGTLSIFGPDTLSVIFLAIRKKK